MSVWTSPGLGRDPARGEVFASPLPYTPTATALVVALLVGGDLLAFGLCAWAAQAIRLVLFGPMPHSVTLWAAAAWWLAFRFYERLYPGYGLSGPDELRRA